MSYSMLKIPVTARLTDEKGVQRHNPTVRKSPAASGRPLGAPVIGEMERIRQLRLQRFQNIWRAQIRTYEIKQPVQEPEIEIDSGPAP